MLVACQKHEHENKKEMEMIAQVASFGHLKITKRDIILQVVCHLPCESSHCHIMRKLDAILFLNRKHSGAHQTWRYDEDDDVKKNSFQRLYKNSSSALNFISEMNRLMISAHRSCH